MLPKELKVRFRVDFGGDCSVGIGKIELLEGISTSGSLSQAARNMRMSYRRAWLLLADLNVCFDEPVAVTSTGGRGGGGVLLTPFGERLVAGYRKMSSKVQDLADVYFQSLVEHVKAPRAPRSKKTVPITSIKRRAARS